MAHSPAMLLVGNYTCPCCVISLLVSFFSSAVQHCFGMYTYLYVHVLFLGHVLLKVQSVEDEYEVWRQVLLEMSFVGDE